MKVTSTLRYELCGGRIKLEATKQENEVKLYITTFGEVGHNTIFIKDEDEYNQLMFLLNEMNMIYDD